MGFNTKSYDWGIPFTQAFDNGGGSTGKLTLYVGRADPGTAKSAAKWAIYKIIYDVNDNVSDIQWASGTIDFDKAWDSRTSYIYS